MIIAPISKPPPMIPIRILKLQSFKDVSHPSANGPNTNNMQAMVSNNVFLLFFALNTAKSSCML